jgi:hypothetical protein
MTLKPRDGFDGRDGLLGVIGFKVAIATLRTRSIVTSTNDRSVLPSRP